MVMPKHFVKRGMLPKELPPNFTSELYARALNTATTPPFATDKTWVHLTQHSLARASGVRRVLSIPNPIGHYRISAEIALRWPRLRQHFARSTWSRSLPTLRPQNQRAAGPRVSGDTTVYEKARCRATARYLLRADVAEFYRSMYTHSIPWALEGKDYVKSVLRNTSVLWSSALDTATQRGQSGQTNGIPCGPDTSFILGEILLSAVDFELQRKLPFVRGYRYYDDYELAVGTLGEAEEGLNYLQNELERLDLQLNSTKTKIIELPLVAEGSISWVKAFPASLINSNLQDGLLEFYRRVFEHRQADPASQVVSLAISRMPERNWSEANWELAQDLMSQAVISDTGAMHQYVRSLVKLRVKRDIVPDPERLTECLSQVILRHAPLGHGSEVAWALWACMAFEIKLPEKCGQAISEMHDDIVALLALELESRGGFQHPINKSRWESWMNRDQLRNEHWLVAYEAYERGWLPSSNGSDYIASDTDFNWLRNNGVRFTKQFRKPTMRTLKEIRLIRNGYDFDDDYDNDDDENNIPF
jgi:hypothetical protein